MPGTSRTSVFPPICQSRYFPILSAAAWRALKDPANATLLGNLLKTGDGQALLRRMAKSLRTEGTAGGAAGAREIQSRIVTAQLDELKELGAKDPAALQREVNARLASWNVPLEEKHQLAQELLKAFPSPPQSESVGRAKELVEFHQNWQEASNEDRAGLADALGTDLRVCARRRGRRFAAHRGRRRRPAAAGA